MDTDWRLSYGDTDFEFGTVDSKFVFPQDTPPAIASADITNQDAQRPYGDGTLFGADTRRGTTVTMDVEVNGADEDESRLLLQQIGTAWRADAIRSTPNAMAVLTTHTGRSTFGRPRRFAPKLDLLPFGITAVTCDFETADDLWYGAPQTATVDLVPDVGGGLVAPLAAPLSTTATSDRSQTIRIGGEVATWPVIAITGPITNPEIEVLGQFKMVFRLSIAYDQTLIIDTRPWARTTMLDGASVAGKRDPRYSRLSEASLAPGLYDLALRGTSATGTPRADFMWRDAHPTL